MKHLAQGLTHSNGGSGCYHCNKPHYYQVVAVSHFPPWVGGAQGYPVTQGTCLGREDALPCCSWELSHDWGHEGWGGMEHLFLSPWGRGLSEGVVEGTGWEVQCFGLLCLVDKGPQAPPLALETARSPGTQRW